jgi:hypothetical protein
MSRDQQRPQMSDLESLPRVFLDCEFTDLLAPDLLSLGMVSMDGQECYIELDLDTDIGRAKIKKSSDFVRYGGVLDYWGMPGAACVASEMGLRAGQWLLDYAERAGSPIEVCFDYSVDYELLEYAIRDCSDPGLWDRVREVVSPVNVDSITGTMHGDVAAEVCWEQLKVSRGLHRHHALADALALRAAWLAAVRAGQAR